MSNSPKKDKITPSDVKRLAEECEIISKSLTFDNPILSETRIVAKVKHNRESSRFSQLLEYTIPEDNSRDNITEIEDEDKLFQDFKYGIEKARKEIGETSIIEEGVVDYIRKWAGKLNKGLVGLALIAQILSTNVATAQELKDGGVEPERIEMAKEQGGIEIESGRPLSFNFIVVKAVAINDVIDKNDVKVVNAQGIGSYQSSQLYEFKGVPYKLETSKNFNRGWRSSMAYSFKGYEENVDKGNTYDFVGKPGRGKILTVGSKDASPIKYTISDYPMQITHADTTLDFLGVQVIYGNPGNKETITGEQNQSSKLNSAGEIKREFIEGQGKTEMSFYANTASVTLIYGQGVEKEDKVVTPEPLEMKSSELFKYNSTKVNTESSTYKNMLDSLESYINKYPDAKFEFTAIGSSSQVPTNYPTLSGEKTVEANGQLAKDRSLAIGKQLLSDLQKKGVDIKDKIVKKTLNHKIGDIEYNEDPENVERYLPDQYAGFSIKTAK